MFSYFVFSIVLFFKQSNYIFRFVIKLSMIWIQLQRFQKISLSIMNRVIVFLFFFFPRENEHRPDYSSSTTSNRADEWQIKGKVNNERKAKKKNTTLTCELNKDHPNKR